VGATYAPITVLNTGTVKMASSSANFTPIYAPAKTSITTTDFLAEVNFTTARFPVSVAIGDLDGDGKPDLAVANYSATSVSVFRNTSASGSIAAGSFATKVDFTTGNSPQSVAIGDLDGDGKPDLVVVNNLFTRTSTVSVLRNTSTSGTIDGRSFATKVDFTTGQFSVSVAIGDLDGDGKPDLAVANNGTSSNSVSVLHNTGSSGTVSFADKVDFTAGNEPISVAIGDLNNDGKPDLVVANNGASQNISVFPNISTPGSITSMSFDSKVDFPMGSSKPRAVAIGDLDVDGKPDLVVVFDSQNRESNVSVLQNTSISGTVSFAPKIDFATGGKPRSVAIGDLDGDGKPDLAVANESSDNASVFRNTGTSLAPISFDPKVNIQRGDGPQSVAIGDLDGDGKPDLAVANGRSNTVSVFRNADIAGPTITSFRPLSSKPGDAVTITGTGFNTTSANNIVFFGATKATLTAVSATSITATVPTGATYAPITVLNTATVMMASSRVSFNPIYAPAKTSITTTDFLPKIDFATGTKPESVAIGDLDGDGKPDLAVANGGANTVSVYLNTSASGSIATGSFATKVDFVTGTAPLSVAIGDLDGDGKPDLAVANYSSVNVSVFRNISTSGTVSFAPKIDFATGSEPYSVAIGDLDGDGKPDLAVANSGSSSNNVSVLRNISTSSTVSFAAKVDFATGTGPSSVVIGDLDGDRKLDLATANNGSNNVSVLRNTGTSMAPISFAAKVDFATGSEPESVTIGDLDSDGKPDLAVVNYNSANVSVLRNTGTSMAPISFAAKVDFPTGTRPHFVAIGDLNGDGKPDLAVANSTSSNVSVLRNTSNSGTVTFAAKEDFVTGSEPHSVAIGDLDGDGKPDLAVTNNGIGVNTVSVFRNADIAGPTITSFTPLSAKPGDAVTITGTGFNTTSANNIVFFGATKATLTAASATSITATVPVGATYAPITVLNTATVLMASSRVSFTPIYAPAKTGITATDFLPKIDFATGNSPQSVAIGDLDGDGKPDLAVANGGANTVSVYRNTSASGSIDSRSFATKVDFTVGRGPGSVVIGDVDGDGKLDLVVGNNNSNTVSVFRNISASGTIDMNSFANKVDINTGINIESVAISDLDGDGRLDLAVTGLIVNGFVSSNTVSVFSNTSTSGNVSFATKVDFVPGGRPYSVAIGDLDGDGKPDLAVANEDAFSVSVLRNTSTPGSVSFAGKIDFATGGKPSSVAIGDLDSDGKPDLALGSDNTTDVSVLRNTSISGSVSFATTVLFSIGNGRSSVVIGDMDGDGKPDLVGTNNSSFVSVLRNVSSSGTIAAGSFAAKVDFATGASPISVAIGDLDGDGKPDLVTANTGFNTNTVSVLRNADIVTSIITTTGTLTAFTSCAGTASAEQSFTVSGSGLTANLVVTAPTGFQVSLLSGSGFGSSVSKSPTSGTVGSTTIYVRMSATATGTPSVNIACTSTGATAKDVAASGTVTAASVGGTVSAAQTICLGTAPANLSLTGNTGTVVKWQSSTDAAFTTPTDIAGTTTTLTGVTIGNLTANTYFRAVVKSGTCAEAFSGSVLITVSPVSVGGTMSAAQTICSGTSPANLSLTGNTGNVVKWQKATDAAFTSPTDIAGTTTTLTGATIGNLTVNTYFRAVVKSGTCAEAFSDAVLITVKSLPAAPTISGNTEICFGQSAILNANDTTRAPSTYQWSYGLMGRSVVVSPVVATNYQVAVTANGCTSALSAVFAIMVNPKPGPPTITADNMSICKGGSVILTGTCSVTSNQFRWTTPEFNTNGIATLPNSNVRTINTPGVYRGLCESDKGCLSEETSITISQGSNCNGENFITITPEKPAICPNTSIMLTASGCSGTVTWAEVGGTTTQTGTTATFSPTVTKSYGAACSTGGSAVVTVVVAAANVAVANNVTTGIERVKAVSNITSDKKVGSASFTPGANVIYEAGGSITLEPGFTAEKWSVFKAEIKVCPN
jgi:hypothetical protein